VTTVESPELSVVVPVYNEADNIDAFLSRLLPILGSETSSFEIIFSADPSRDTTVELIRRARHLEPRIKLLVFSRQVGQPAATLAGIEHASGQAVLVMDVDLQDPPELIPELLAKWREGYDVAYAQRRARAGERWLKKRVSSAGYRFLNRFSDVEIPRETGDFRIMDRRVVSQLLRFSESHGFLRGLVALVGFRQAAVAFDRPARHSGRGHYNRSLGSLKIGFNGIVGFSNALLNLSTVMGFGSAAFSLLFGTLYVIFKLSGTNFPVGNPTIVTLVLFIGGVQLICVGILGQYLGRIYDEVKRRPRYIVDVSDGFDNAGDLEQPGPTPPLTVAERPAREQRSS
jgi:glycosyltransferase involved in cell wall biosynthesis